MKTEQNNESNAYDSDDEVFQPSRRSLEFAGPQAGDARNGAPRKISIHRNESDDNAGGTKNPAKSASGAGLKDKLKAKFSKKK